MDFDLAKLIPDIRCLNDMRGVLYDREFAKTAENRDLYFMYRGLEEKDLPAQAGGLRYDITVIPAGMLGNEFAKTKGHYHIGSYGEVYTVLEGSAIYLLQKIGGNGNIQDVYAVKAKKGDVVIIPPFYGHVTINPSKKEALKMANWVSPLCNSDYSLYEKMRGACYYFIRRGIDGLSFASWMKNENYLQIPELRFEKPLKSVPENLSFLKNG